MDGYLVWLIERCCRRRDNADTVERLLLYEERVTILYGLKSAVEGPDDNFRATAYRTLGNMSDISDDENSPNYERIHAEHASVDQTMIAYNFVLALQSGSASSTGFSTNVDTLYNAIGAGRFVPDAHTNDDAESSESEGETRSQAYQRYMNVEMDEISDPELWAELHYGSSEDSMEVDASNP